MFRYLILVLVLFQLTCSPVISQDIITRKTAPKKVLKLYKEAQEDSRSISGVKKAIKKLEKVILKIPNFLDARLFLATLYIEEKRFDEGISEYNNVINIKSDYKVKVYYALGRAYEKNKQFDEAIKTYDTYLKQKNTKPILIEKCQKAIKTITFRRDALKNPVEYNPQKLPPIINTSSKEYLPFITADGNQMIFTRRDQDENFFASYFVEGEWTKPIFLNEINTEQNEGAHTLSPDGKTLYYTFCDDHVTMGSCDLYYSKKINGKWREPKNLGKNINSEAWDTQPTISADGQTLYFISKRSGGFGGSDIWFSKKKRGKWQKPVNAGPKLNTSEDEITPFLHPDGQTLYFASSGHPGMGSTDIFISRKEINGEWGDPVNVGYPINTKEHEGDLFVDFKGNKAYFASDKDQKGNIDIYYFDLPESIKPQKVLYVKGTVKDIETNQNIPSYIKINQLDGNYAAKVKTDINGDYLIALPIGFDYTFNVSKKGYVFFSDRLNIPKSMSDNIDKNIGLTPITNENKEKILIKNKPIVLNNVLFKSGSFELLNISTYELNNLVQLLKDLPDSKVLISGHTDDVGNDTSNQKLSEKRAKSVVDYLIKKGIESTRLKYKGYGEMQPIESNDNELGRKMNRRTTFEII